VPQLSSENWSICNASFIAMFNLLHSSTNQQLFKKLICSQSNHYEKSWLFLCCEKKPSHATTIDTFFCQQRWMAHKGGTGKYIKNALCVLWYAKSTSWAEVTLNSEAHSLSHCQVTLVWRQAGCRKLCSITNF